MTVVASAAAMVSTGAAPAARDAPPICAALSRDSGEGAACPAKSDGDLAAALPFASPSVSSFERILSADFNMMFLYTWAVTVATIEPTAVPSNEPAMPICDDSKSDVTAASAVAITWARDRFSNNEPFFFAATAVSVIYTPSICSPSTLEGKSEESVKSRSGLSIRYEMGAEAQQGIHALEYAEGEPRWSRGKQP